MLSVTRSGEEAADGVARQLPGEEQPVDRAVERELGCTAGEDEQHHVSIAPNPPHDGAATHEVGHSRPACNDVARVPAARRMCFCHFLITTSLGNWTFPQESAHQLRIAK